MKIEFSTDNAAFHAPEGYDINLERNAMAREIGNLFEDICMDIKLGETSGVLIDSNGNKVGLWALDLSENNGGNANDKIL